jgi:hypothetical protein
MSGLFREFFPDRLSQKSFYLARNRAIFEVI